MTDLCRRVKVDDSGNFYQVFQQNKWRLRIQREQQQRRQQQQQPKAVLV